MDANGYPTDEELEKVKTWHINGQSDYLDLMHYVEELWYYKSPYFEEEEGGKFTLITGGWSGNEQVIRALEDNIPFWVFYWEMSERGGYHEFCPMDYYTYGDSL